MRRNVNDSEMRLRCPDRKSLNPQATKIPLAAEQQDQQIASDDLRKRIAKKTLLISDRSEQGSERVERLASCRQQRVEVLADARLWNVECSSRANEADQRNAR